MTTFDEREQAFENKFKHDQELLFRIQSRRAKLMGQWAAGLLGLRGDEAEAYAKQAVHLDFDQPGRNAVVAKILQDFKAVGVNLSEHQIEKEMEAQLELARQQIQSA
jgi:hypothetical protein